MSGFKASGIVTTKRCSRTNFSLTVRESVRRGAKERKGFLFESAAIRDAMLKMQMAEGWAESLECLKEHLAKV